MDNFVVSARKYRPSAFDAVVGQESITRTLKNSLKNNHLAHSYLFTGPRGVGKTTCARIFAKTINCKNLSEDFEACNECDSCLAFNRSSSFNIHELDAASNNSVDDIRTLIDQVRIPPQVGNYSVYIIDEVHMLSSAAFNAFLKTLEEPPKHAVFILATTEKHKIIPTILSRCQIYDFNRINVNDIVSHISEVAEKEGVEIESDALNIIAQKADGAMRDALSIFDQIVSFAGKNVTYKDVIDNLNVLDYDYYFRLTNAFLAGNLSEALLIYNEILSEGFDGHHFITGLSSHFRDLLVCKDAETIELMEVGEKISEGYKLQAVECSQLFLLRALKISNDCDLSYKSAINKRLQIEIALMQICYLNQEQPITEVSENKVQSRPVQKPKAQPEAKKETVQKPISRTVTPTATAKPKFEKQPGKSSIPSIKDALKETETKKTEQKPAEKKADIEEEVVVEENQNFSQDQLAQKWKELAERYKEKTRLYQTLNNTKPKLSNDFSLTISLDNEGQVEYLKTLKGQMENFLRRELKNGEINIQMVIEERKEEEKVYTDRDKLDYLKNKNPDFNDLQQEFNLDFGP